MYLTKKGHNNEVQSSWGTKEEKMNDKQWEELFKHSCFHSNPSFIWDTYVCITCTINEIKYV